MYFKTHVLAITSLVSLALCSPMSPGFESRDAAATQYFKLKSSIKPGQDGKSAFDGLYLSDYHTGAALSDAVFYPDHPDYGKKAYLDSPQKNSWGAVFYHAVFDMGNDFPWNMIMTVADPDALWQPIRINAASKPMTGYFMNVTGLQYSSSLEAPGTEADKFGGWIVCNSDHGVPQLYYHYHSGVSSGSAPPSDCADIDLKPEWIA